MRKRSNVELTEGHVAPVRTRAELAVLAASLVLATGCAEHYIPNTDVEDTEENRDIIEFCERYRKAVERKDAAGLLALISPDYYEDGGNPDASDDMDYAQFRKWITGEAADEDGENPSFLDATSIRHEIRYRRVVKENDRVFVDYTFSASFRIPTSHGDQWKRKVDDNRLELVLEKDGQYRIIAGM